MAIGWTANNGSTREVKNILLQSKYAAVVAYVLAYLWNIPKNELIESLFSIFLGMRFWIDQ